MNRNLADYLNLPYEIVIIKEEDGGLFVKIKELEGCISHGETIEEAYKMIEDAKKCWIETALEEGIEIPLPESMQKKPSGKFVLRLPSSLHSKLNNKAKEENLSLNTYITTMLTEQITAVEVSEKCLENFKLFMKSEVPFGFCNSGIIVNMRVHLEMDKGANPACTTGTYYNIGQNSDNKKIAA